MGGEMLSQDDVDALLNQVGGNQEPGPEEPGEEPVKATIKAAKNRSDEDVKSIMDEMYRRANLSRDEGVKIIWNASDVFPMVSGLSMKIQGMEYISLGSLHGSHLIVGQRQHV